MPEEKGKWITTKTKRHVFIPEGQSIEEVLNEEFDSEPGNDIIFSEDLISKSQDLNDDEKEFIRTTHKNIKPEAVEMLNHFNNVKMIKINNNKPSCFNRSTKTIEITPDSLKEIEPGTDFHATGQTMLHEEGHYIDNELSRYIVSHGIYASSSYISDKYKKSLHDMIKTEKSKLSRVEGVKMLFDASLSYFEKFTDDENMLKIKNFYEQHLNEAFDYAFKYVWKYDNFINRSSDNMGPFQDTMLKYMNNKISEEFGIDNKNEFNSILYKSSYYGCQKYDIVSDMFSSRREYTQSKVACVGHGATYFNKRLYYGLGTEFFASYFSAWSRNDIEEMEITKKYFPKSCEIFGEMITKFKEKKNGRN